MMRRGWLPVVYGARNEFWGVDAMHIHCESGETFATAHPCRPLPDEVAFGAYPDPFTALTEADRWMTEQEAKK